MNCDSEIDGLWDIHICIVGSALVLGTSDAKTNKIAPNKKGVQNE